MAKFYFTFGYDDGGGWVEVSADSYTKASAVFKLYHPPREGNLLPCDGVYSEEEFQRTTMSRNGNYDKHCVEYIVLNRFAFKEGNDGADT